MIDIIRCRRRVTAFLDQHGIALGLTAMYAAVVIFFSCTHVLWRDEVRALSIAAESKSIVQLFQNLHNEGHPFLWYFLLWIGFHLTHSVVILKVVSIAVATFAAYLFLSRSPFSFLQKIVFLLGVFPIYQYSVVCRGYGLSMALLFLFCCLYKDRFKKSLLVAGVLFLLANSEPHALILTVALFLSMMAEAIFKREDVFADSCKRNHLIAASFIIVVGILVSVWQLYPDRTIVTSSVHSVGITTIGREFSSAMVSAGRSFESVLRVPLVPAVVMVWLFLLCLVRNIFLLGFSVVGITGLVLLGRLVYPLGFYHQGFLLLVMLAALWMDQVTLRPVYMGVGRFRKVLGFVMTHYRAVFVYMLLIPQVIVGHEALMRDFKNPASSAKAFGEFLKVNPGLKDAIILGEPDYLLESLPYYAGNPIYIAREGRFGKTVKFTTQNKRTQSLEELLETAQRLKKDYQRPVLLALGHQLNPEGPFLRLIGYAGIFTYSLEQHDTFLQATEKIGAFHRAVTDERYDVFLLK